jgi:chitin disaccharide deacetylase
MKKINFCFILCAVVFTGSVAAQHKESIPELLGYPANTKLLIIHADDMGLSNSTNLAVIKAFASGSITSGSVMVPCPWAPEIAAYVKAHPGLDVGIHFTLNAEWKYYKCGGVLPSCDIKSLVDKEGNFFPTVQQVAFFAKPEDVEKELRAQIDRAIAMGIKPTHLDSHMGSMYVSPAVFRTAMRVAGEYQLPVSLPLNLVKTAAPFLLNEITPDMVGVDNFLMLDGNALGGDWNVLYAGLVNSLIPGLNEIVVHLSYDNDEMKAITVEHDDYGSAWRQRDLDLVTSEAFKKLLKDNQVQLVTWKQIQEAIYKK